MGEKMRGKKIVLIVEDDQHVSEILTLSLESQGATVITLSSGREVVDQASRLNPRLILLDLLIPDKNGLDVLSDLKNGEKTRHIPVIVCSSQLDEEPRLAAEKRGAESYLTKPFDVPYFVQLVSKFL